MCLHLNQPLEIGNSRARLSRDGVTPPTARTGGGEGDSDSTIEGEGSGGDGAVVVAEHGGRAGGVRRQ
jgi:hypothetical protein